MLLCGALQVAAFWSRTTPPLRRRARAEAVAALSAWVWATLSAAGEFVAIRLAIGLGAAIGLEG